MSRRAWAFMMRSMLALHPYSPVTSTQGLSTTRSDVTTCGHDHDEHLRLDNEGLWSNCTDETWHEWQPYGRDMMPLAASKPSNKRLIRR